MIGLYIHVPFCGSRCAYCDFFSTTQLERRGEYVDGLCRELAARRTGEEVATIYLGGGTPSMLSQEQLARIMECIHGHYNVASNAEITLEANPDDVTSHFTLLTSHFNRLSLGVQSFNNERLRLIRRRHTAEQAIAAIGTARSCGVTNISIDLIYGLPGQTMDEWRHDVERALSLPVAHLSAYALSYEPGTLLYKMRERGEICEASDELSRRMYYHLLDAAEAKGFVHYEISNFALSGFESRHNSSYWTGVPYLGFGPGAHSYDGHATRRSNPTSIDRWLAGEHDEEHLTQADLFNERVFLSLRTRHGLDLPALEHRFPAFSRTIRPTLLRHLGSGLLEQSDGTIKVAREAIFTSDDIISDLMV